MTPEAVLALLSLVADLYRQVQTQAAEIVELRSTWRPPEDAAAS